MEKGVRDAKTRLLYHGYDESRQQAWSDPKTGRSPSFWGRAVGWHFMALVDTLDFFPSTHVAKRDDLVAILQRLVEGVAKVQDLTNWRVQMGDDAAMPSLLSHSPSIDKVLQILFHLEMTTYLRPLRLNPPLENARDSTSRNFDKRVLSGVNKNFVIGVGACRHAGPGSSMQESEGSS
ncbi:hypothetical protein L7F22_046002 [Adiantum nelumboides]|nr:hypothetical protein [Adiantum nelumboides]